MKKCEIIAWFTLALPAEAASWSDDELKMVLEENLKHWAGTVDGKFGLLHILIKRSKPASAPE